MKVLLLSNQHPNKQGVGNPIMHRMQNALKQNGTIETVEFLPFYNRLSSFIQIRKKTVKFDIVHIHFGGLYALLIWISLIGLRTKKFITFHGTDIHAKQLKNTKNWKKRLKIRLNQKASFLSIRLFDKCGFVAKEMMTYVPNRLKKYLDKKAFVHPLGVDYDTFKILDKIDAQNKLKIPEKKYVLFSDVSNTSIKRRDIAQNIVKELGGEYKLLIMCGVKPDEVPLYVNACDFLLLTSDEEGSPNIIRECLALNKPVFSVEVGDAAKQLNGLVNSKIINRDSKVAASEILKCLEIEYTDNTRTTLKKRLDFRELNKDIVDLYKNVINE